MPKPLPRTTSASTTLVLSAVTALLTTIAPLRAESLKSMMGEMARTTKEAKAALSANDAAAFDAILRAYGDQARAGIALFPGGSAKGQDLRKRFSAFAATADAARQSGSNPAGFKTAFGSLVSACRSCHSVYK